MFSELRQAERARQQGLSVLTKSYLPGKLKSKIEDPAEIGFGAAPVL